MRRLITRPPTAPSLSFTPFSRALTSTAPASTTSAASASSFALNVGLEVHLQILSASKLFSGASTDTARATLTGANSAVSLFDAALPGTLPSPNARCVEAAVLTSSALGCKINPESAFDRKHYFYPDLPLGYQITQLDKPIASDGCVRLTVKRSAKRGKGSVMDVYDRSVVIERVQLEQDSGKSNHTLSHSSTLVDLNRAGVGLLEIVTGPDIRSPAEAMEFLRVLQRLIRHIGTCDGNMEEGSMRCDVNVSVRRTEDDPLGDRVEIKNLNSIKSVGRVIEQEFARQSEMVESGEVVVSETRSFDPSTGLTTRLRSKEDAPDYRFFPDPDLPTLVLSSSYIDNLVTSLPELPLEIQDRFVSEYGLALYDAVVLVGEIGAAEFFEETLRCQGDKGVSPKTTCNWIVNELFGRLHSAGLTMASSIVSPAHLAELITLIRDGEVSTKAGKDVLDAMFAGEPGSPKEIVEAKGWTLLRDEGELRRLCDAVVVDPANGKLLAKFKSKPGERTAGAFIGKVLAASGGRADPKLTKQLMMERLEGV